MAVRLVFLGRLEDVAGAAELSLPGPFTYGALIGRLTHELAEALSGERIRLALNGSVIARDAALEIADGDELAFLPPVSGG